MFGDLFKNKKAKSKGEKKGGKNTPKSRRSPTSAKTSKYNSSDDAKKSAARESDGKQILYEKRKAKLLKSTGDLPEFEKVCPSGMPLYQLNDLDKRHVAVLCSSYSLKSYFLVVSSKRITLAVDDIIDKIKTSARKEGCKVADIFYIEPSLISDLYSKSDKEGSSELDSSEIANEFDDIIKYAADHNVSDVHFEVTQDAAVVRIRRNSLLEDFSFMGVEHAFDFCTVVYQVLSESGSKDISFLPRRQQSSIVVRDIPGHGIIRIRLNTIPTAPSGFDMVLRLLKSGDDKKLTLPQLGYNKTLMKSLEVAASKPVGALIIAGTTGSGKSTTLKTLLEGKVDQFSTPNGVTIKIITVEDPPEYDIKGVSQCNVSTSTAAGDDQNAKNPFRDAIKAAMRCDPDILMAGEVRDEDSAELLMHITLSGHQVMTTIHASSAISIVARLRNNGIPNDALGNSDFLSGLVYQKLVPIACQECSIPYGDYKPAAESEADKELLSRIDQVVPDGKKDGIIFRNFKGCSKCKSGVIGQTVVAEVILPDHVMLDHFIKGEDHKAWHHHKKMGGQTIIDHAIEKVVSGTCDPRDIEVKIGLMTMDLVMDDSKFEYSEMEKHGFSNDEKEVEVITYEDLNDIRKKKVDRAVLLVETQAASGDIPAKHGFSRDLFANLIHNNIYTHTELKSLGLYTSSSLGVKDFDAVMEEIRPILK